MAYCKVRVGIRVERSLDGEFDYSMFHCRKRREGVADWASELISNMPYMGVPDGHFGERSMKPGEVRRYWANITLTATRDYWEEVDEYMEVISTRRAK